MDEEKPVKPISVGMRQAAKMVGISDWKLKPLVYSGRIASFLIGRRRLIPVKELERYVEECLEAAK